MRRASERYLKDIGLHFQFSNMDSLIYKLTLYDKTFHTKYLAGLIKFLDKIRIEHTNNVEDYFAKYTAIKEAALSEIKARMQQLDLSTIQTDLLTKDIPSSIYKATNMHRAYISIDMHHANFNALKYKGVFTENTWEDFIKKFTDDKHIINSKYIRQVIFGNCNPKLQMRFEKEIISKFLTFLQKNIRSVLPHIKYTIAAITNDEVILEVEDNVNDLAAMESLVHACIEEFYTLHEVPLTIKTFMLHVMQSAIEIHSDGWQQDVSDHQSVIGYIRQFYSEGEPTSDWDYKCFDNVQIPFLLCSVQQQNIYDKRLFEVETQWGPAILDYVKACSLPDFLQPVSQTTNYFV